jgi:hypothetical protein
MTGQANAYSLEYYVAHTVYLTLSPVSNLQTKLNIDHTLPYLALSYWVYTKPLLEDSPTKTELISHPAPMTEYN